MRLNIGVIFGGKSVEHEISIISAIEAMGYADENKYKIVPIYIDKDNTWYTGEHLKSIINFRDIDLVKRYAKKVALIKVDKSFVLQKLGMFKKNLCTNWTWSIPRRWFFTRIFKHAWSTICWP